MCYRLRYSTPVFNLSGDLFDSCYASWIFAIFDKVLVDFYGVLDFYSVLGFHLDSDFYVTAFYYTSTDFVFNVFVSLVFPYFLLHTRLTTRWVPQISVLTPRRVITTWLSLARTKFLRTLPSISPFTRLTTSQCESDMERRPTTRMRIISRA